MSRGELELAVRPPLSSYSIATQRRPARGGFSGDTASSGNAADSSSGVSIVISLTSHDQTVGHMVLSTRHPRVNAAVFLSPIQGRAG